MARKSWWRDVKEIFEDPSRRLITHDLKILLKFFAEQGIELKCSTFDTLLAAYRLKQISRPTTFLSCWKNYLGKTISWPEKKAEGKEKEEQEVRSLSQSIKEIPLLAEILQHNLELRRLKDLFFNLELPLVPVLAKMELKGIKVDESIFRELAGEMEASLLQLEKEITLMAGESFNLNSPQQLSYISF